MWTSLIGSHVAHPAAETLRRLTADIRHESRVEAVHAAALNALADAGLCADSAAMDAAVQLLCETELAGCGGPRGLGLNHARGDRRTGRMPWAQGLGKGRHRASDGPCWDAAIRDCAERIPEGTACWLWCAGDPELAWCGEPPTTDGLALSVIGARLVPADRLAPIAWQIAICGRTARDCYVADDISAALQWAARYQVVAARETEASA